MAAHLSSATTYNGDAFLFDYEKRRRDLLPFDLGQVDVIGGLVLTVVDDSSF